MELLYDVLEESGLAPSSSHVSDAEGVDLIELLDSARDAKRPNQSPTIMGLKSVRDDLSEGSRSPRGRARKSEDDDSGCSPAGKHQQPDNAAEKSNEKKDKTSGKDTEGSDSWSDGEVECVIDFKGHPSSSSTPTKERDGSDTEDPKDGQIHKSHSLKSTDHKKSNLL